MTSETILDCGHALPAEYTQPERTGGTGYACIDNRRICYTCSAEVTRTDMIATGRACLYLVDSQAAGRAWTLQDWPGQLSFPVTRSMRSQGRGFGGRLYPIVAGKFTGPDGKPWAFRNAGNNQIARCKRCTARETLPVIFRTDRTDGTVTAVFPTQPGTDDASTFVTYAHVGQHGSGAHAWYDSTRAATSEEYAPLLAELRAIYEQGADAVRLKVITRFNHAHRTARRAAVRLASAMRYLRALENKVPQS